MFVYPKRYDVIVVGAGHAGIEAALASARMGCSTLLLTTQVDTIGQMSCNPAIGGLAKGHLAREIDALGGEMGRTTDMTGIHFRMLNQRKGPSVWAPRAQCDKKAYQFRMKWICEREPRLDIRQAQTQALVLEDGAVVGVDTALEVRFLGQVVVLTTGTFLRGLMHIGSNQQSGGRAGEAASFGLSKSLSDLGLSLGRLKTGTPPRLLRKSVDLSQCETQPGDDPIPWFSFWAEERDDDRLAALECGASARMREMFHVEHPVGGGGSGTRDARFPPGSILSRHGRQVSCWITQTTQRTRELVLANLHRSPMYSGIIEGVGPRYCPSIEDKFVRFSEKPTHQIFLEPEGIATDELYVNGFSTSLPFEVQVEMVRSIRGCEQAEILRPAYAVEYDFVDPTQLNSTLETRACRNLFLAGQINGTSGYEEAAAQGLMAGMNAALRVLGRPPVVLRRDQAYIGVLIDDLVTKGTQEPYRMFTSRAEFRLLLRQDNADLRLSGIGHEAGLLSNERFRRVEAKREQIECELARLRSHRLGQDTLEQCLRRPDVSHRDLPQPSQPLSDEVASQVEITIKYAGYVDRQILEAARMARMEEQTIPLSFSFDAVPSLRNEARQKLNRIRPTTIGQAARISGVTPSDLALILVGLRRHGQRSGQPSEGDDANDTASEMDACGGCG